MSNKEYSREEIAQIFIEAHSDHVVGYTDDKAEKVRAAFHYLLGRFMITQQFADSVPGFEYLGGDLARLGGLALCGLVATTSAVSE